ncbi:MAG TPA: tyrosine-type recombinase/integrase [Streptosporangiaceae bacterium]|jgi:integrase/recombinase XerD|nr:tyrosine-type recombinase/integrase [Streptosporangiaceae bacterium]
MRVFPVRLPSGVGYWTVVDEDLVVVPAADAFLRHLRFGRDGAESTTKSYAGGIALFLRWCARTGRDWQSGIGQLGLFMTWLAHAGPSVSGLDAQPGAAVLAGPGSTRVRSERRINAVLAAVRGMTVHAVTEGTAPGHLMQVLYEVADDVDLPAAMRAEDGGTGWRVRPRHRLHEPERPVGRAADSDIVAVLGACGSARDRLIVLLMARAGLRRGEVLGLRRSDVHLLADSRELGCDVTRAHLHVVRRDDNPNGAFAKSRRQRAVPLDFLTVQAFDSWEFERMTVPAAAAGDFVVVNMFREPLGSPMRLDAVNDLVAAAARRAGIGELRPHQMRHAFASNVLDAGGTLEEAQDLLGHRSVASTQVYAHPDPARLRAAVDAVPGPLAQAGGPA